MAYRRYSRRRSTAYRGPSAASQHMQARRALSRRVSGIDNDVLQILYAFSDQRFVDLLIAYENLYGKAATDYMQEAFPKWRDGKTGVSGQNAERLINLAPQFLTQEQRHTLLKKLYDANKSALFEHHRIEVILGHTPDVAAQLDAATQKLCSKPTLNRLPEDVQRTVTWVCNEDSTAARSIMAAIETEESMLLASAGRTEVQRLISLIGRLDRSSQGTHTMRFPYGSLTVSVRQPTFFEKLGRALRS